MKKSLYLFLASLVAVVVLAAYTTASPVDTDIGSKVSAASPTQAVATAINQTAVISPDVGLMATAINSTSILRTYSPDVGLADNPSLTTTANSKTGVDRDVGFVGSIANNSTFVADNAGPAAPTPTARHVRTLDINQRDAIDMPDPDLIL